MKRQYPMGLALLMMPVTMKRTMMSSNMHDVLHPSKGSSCCCSNDDSSLQRDGSIVDRNGCCYVGISKSCDTAAVAVVVG